MLEVVKATQWYTRVTACSQRATSMLLILLEVTVKTTHWLTRVSVYSQTATFMLLITQEVSVKATYWLTRVSACSQTATTMLLIMLEVVKATHWYTKVTAGSIRSNLLVHKSHSLQQNGYSQSHYSAGSDSESHSLVDESLSMQPNSSATSMLLIMLEVSVKATH